MKKALLLLIALAAPLLAAPTEIPRLDADVGTAQSPAPLAPAAASPALSPLDLAVPGLAAPSLTANVASAAQVQAAAAAAPAPRVGSEAFQKTLQRAADGTARIAQVGEKDAQGSAALSSALFDLSAQPQLVPASAGATAGLPITPTGAALARLRRAGELGAPGPGSIPGIAGAKWEGPAGHGRSGDTAKVSIAGRTWYMKRLTSSPDEEIAATPPETRALNEAGFSSILRGDPQLSRSFRVPAQVSVFRDGGHVFVLSEGLPSVGDGESRRQELSPAQRADAAIIQLALGMGDMHGGDVLPLEGGGFGLVDFEKLSRAPLEKASAQKIDSEVMLKNFPLVDRIAHNDPAVYRARFETWSAEYRAGGRARMDRALAAEGWSRPSREAYLSAVDRNLETYFERLKPYIDYANDWHERITKARAEKAREAAAPKKKRLFNGLFGR